MLALLQLAPAYVVETDVFMVAAAGPTVAAQTLAAKACRDTDLRLWRRVRYATASRPDGVTARPVAELDALLARHPKRTIDPERQTGYVRETTGGGSVVVVGDAAYPAGIFYLSVSHVYACRSLAYARSVVDGWYSSGRLTLNQRMGFVGTWATKPPSVAAIRSKMMPLAWDYLNAVRVDLPRVVTSLPPKETALEPYDAAVTDP